MTHSEAFVRVRDAILALEKDQDRARLAALFGCMTEPHRELGPLRSILRLVATLENADLERLAKWFHVHVNAWGQMPRANGLRIKPAAPNDQPKDSK